MARKRSCAPDKNRPNSNAKHRKTMKEGALASSHKKKQTSLLSFWGKPTTNTTVRPKTSGTSKSVDPPKASRSPATKPKSGTTTERSLIVTPSSKQESMKDTETSKTKHTNDHEHRGNGHDRHEPSMEGNTDGNENERLAPNDDSNTKHLIPRTIEEPPSVAITPCKSPGSSSSPAERKEDATTSPEETGSATPTASKHHQDTATASADDEDDDDSSSNAPPASPHTSPSPRPPDALSDYEKLRLRNIERNNARLAALGLLTTTTSTVSARRKPRPPRKRPKIHQPPTRQQPLRRSTRHRNFNGHGHGNPQPKAGDASEVDATRNSPTETMHDRREVQDEEEEEQYTVSPLWQYEMSRAKKRDEDMAISQSNSNSNSMDGSSNAELSPSSSNNMCLRVTGPRFVPPKGLNAIYSLEFWSGGAADASSSSKVESHWLVGAGKAGMIALWDTNAATEPRMDRIAAEEEEGLVDPILSWKAHSGRWIADAKFLPHRSTATSTSTSTSTRVATPANLLTAGNDGTVCLWDLSAVSSVSGAPKLMHRTGKSYHSSGIFCMDISSSSSNPTTALNSDVLVCTGSKDKSIGVSSLDSLLQGTGEPSWRSRFHTAKVGAVNLQGTGSSLVASASDDGVVALHDVRAPSRGSESSLVAQLDDAHDRPHSVVWDTYDPFVFCTAGLDPIVKLWDQRNLSQPLACLQGHIPTSTSRCKKIHRPVFLDPYDSPTRHSNQRLVVGSSSSPFLLTGGQGSSSVSVYSLGSSNLQQQQSTAPLVSRGKLPEDCGDSGCIAVNGKQVAVTVEEGEILLLEPSFSTQ